MENMMNKKHPAKCWCFMICLNLFLEDLGTRDSLVHVGKLNDSRSNQPVVTVNHIKAASKSIAGPAVRSLDKSELVTYLTLHMQEMTHLRMSQVHCSPIVFSVFFPQVLPNKKHPVKGPRLEGAAHVLDLAHEIPIGSEVHLMVNHPQDLVLPGARLRRASEDVHRMP